MVWDVAVCQAVSSLFTGQTQGHSALPVRIIIPHLFYRVTRWNISTIKGAVYIGQYLQGGFH